MRYLSEIKGRPRMKWPDNVESDLKKIVKGWKENEG
jgi:hypothetical protein